MKGNRIIKWMFALIVAAIIGFFGFVFKVNEGEYAVVTRFGAVRSEVTQAGMYLRLPWPFEDVQIQDARKRYLDSGYLETLTHDKKNVIMQTYTIWSIADPLRYYTSVGDTALAETYLSDLVTSAKNGTMGNYDLSALVSLDEEDIKIDEIEAAMLQELFPDAENVGLLYCSAEPNSVFQVETIQGYLEEMGYTCTQYAFTDVNDLSAVTQSACDGSDVIYIPTDNTAANNTETIANVVIPAGVPVVCGESGICSGCGVATLSISYEELGRITGEMAVQILTGEADVSELAIQYDTAVTKMYNATNCEALGITVPDGYQPIE